MSHEDPAHDPDVVELATRLFGHAREGHTHTLAPYLEAGIPANLTNDKGDTLLMLAAYHGHTDTVTLLIDQGADPNRPNDRGQTPLAGAVFKDHEPVVELLTRHGADPDPGTPTARQTAQLFDQRHYLQLFQD